MDRISPQFWSILILESVFLLLMPQNNAFYFVCAFMGPIVRLCLPLPLFPHPYMVLPVPHH